MGRPPLGTRWGDLSPEERAALPVGTRLLAFDGIPKLTRTDWGWTDADGTFYFYPSSHQLLVYPDPIPQPDPRDSDGPVDEGGGEAKGGDNDTDGDVPEVAGFPNGWICARSRRGRWEVDYDTFSETREDITVPGGLKVLRLYWPPTCEGAEDAPRDNFPDSPQEKAP